MCGAPSEIFTPPPPHGHRRERRAHAAHERAPDDRDRLGRRASAAQHVPSGHPRAGARGPELQQEPIPRSKGPRHRQPVPEHRRRTDERAEGGIKLSLPRMRRPPAPRLRRACGARPFLRTPGADRHRRELRRRGRRSPLAARWRLAGRAPTAAGVHDGRVGGAAAAAAAPRDGRVRGGLPPRTPSLRRPRTAMADLQEKLRVSQVRLTTTGGQRVARHRAQDERAQYKQALTSLTNEATALRQREAEQVSLDKLMQKQAAFAATEAKAARARRCAARSRRSPPARRHGRAARLGQRNAALTERIGTAQQNSSRSTTRRPARSPSCKPSWPRRR